MAKKGKGVSCLTLILCFFFFPFIPIVLIWNMTAQLGSSLEDYKKKSVPVKITAYVLIFCGIVYLIAGLTGSVQADNPNDVVFGVIVMLLVCCGGGLAMLAHCRKCKIRAGYYDLYVPFITNKQVFDISQLASMAGVSQDHALKQLNSILGHGVLKNAQIDRYENRIILPQPEIPVVPTKIIICPHCNGTNEVPEGTHGVCSYCDMPLE